MPQLSGNIQNTTSEELICPVRGKFIPCDPAELEPLRDHLKTLQPVQEETAFPRGTLLPDGRLDLCKQNIGAGGALLLAESAKRFPHLKHLLLGANGLGPSGAKTIAEIASENPHLETLYLGCNLIDEAGTEALAKAVSQHPSMKSLWIKRNPIGLRGAEAIVRMLNENRQLRTLDLVYTDLTCAGVKLICETVAQEECSLTRLYLGGNRIGIAEARYVANIILNNRKLTELYLSVNRLGDEGISILAEALSENRTLEKLSLASNGIGPDGAWQLAQALKAHPALWSLDLGFDRATYVLGEQANRLGNEGAAAISELLQANSTLEFLDLTGNEITTDGAHLLADALETQTSLRELRFSKGVSRSLKKRIRKLLVRNQTETAIREPDPDIAAIVSVYRTSPSENS